MNFTLKIQLGNDAMITDEYLANTINDVANTFLQREYVHHLNEEGCGSIVREIRDEGGNVCGEFRLSY
jgi:hypothetical protein